MTEHGDLFDQLINSLMAPVIQRLNAQTDRITKIEEGMVQHGNRMNNHAQRIERLERPNVVMSEGIQKQVGAWPFADLSSDIRPQIGHIASQLENLVLDMESQTVRYRQPHREDTIQKLKSLALQLRKLSK